jgi:multidrug efflux system outer membrane protein
MAIRSSLRALRPIGAMAVASMVLCACASSVPAQPELIAVDVPAHWARDAPAEVPGPMGLADWWKRFDDPVLSQLIDESLLANTSVLSAQATLKQALAARDASAAALWPQLDASASTRRSKSGDVWVPAQQVGLDASWVIDVFGGNRHALAASDAAALSSQASLGDVQVALTSEVALSYITLRASQARQVIAQSNVSSLQETLDITHWRVQAGLLTSLEDEQAKAAVEQAHANASNLDITIEQTRHALSVLTARSPGALNSVLSSQGPLPQAPEGLALSAPPQTLLQRADVRAARHQVQAARERVAAADAARYPSFSLGAALGLSARTLASLASGSAGTSALLAQASLPVFNGGALNAQVREQQAALDGAQARYEATVLAALQEVEDALSAVRGNLKRLANLERAAVSASQAAQLARQRYSGGLVDFQSVLETQRTQFSTQDTLMAVRAELSADHVRLYKALGGGWQPKAVEPRSSTPVTHSPEARS